MISSSVIPQNPGVYLFKDSDGRILYVGKAKNLRKRVSSYFRGAKDKKTTILVRNIQDVDFIIVDNEVEALLLENKLIKKHEPKYNILLKDAKTYAYIFVSDEKYPRVHSSRKTKKKGKYFGPYVGGISRKEVVEMTNKLFQLRTCRNLPDRACLNYHIGLCSAPCVDQVSQEEYKEQVKGAIEFLKGNTKPIVGKLYQDMEHASHTQKYEIALEKKRQIQAVELLDQRQKVDLIKDFDQNVIGYVANDESCVISLFSIVKGVISGKRDFTFDVGENVLLDFLKMYYSQHYIPTEIVVSHKVWETLEERGVLEEYLGKLKKGRVRLVVPERGEKKRLIELAQKNARYKLDNKTLREVREKLNLPRVPRVIECFDMSNLSYDHLVGGMVQFVDGKPNPSAYRKFLIKDFMNKNDDFAAMREVVYRRYKRIQEEDGKYPDLIIVDGGKGQLSAALDSLQRLGLQIPIVGLAKKEEELFLPGMSASVLFPPNGIMMLFIRQIRDTAHRFVISYNRKRREMKMREEMHGEV